jgi:hypothetical protein
MSHRAMPPSREGSVVLDIGGRVGALVVMAGADRSGAELELTPADGRRAKVHSEVRPRRLGPGERYAAVFPQLLAGDYEVEETGQRISVGGGMLTVVVLSEPPG